MSDIFHEVDEEVRREQLKRLWDRFGLYIVAAAVLVVVGIGAWRAYQWYEAKQAAESGAAYEAAVLLSAKGQSADAQAAFAKVATEGTAGYRALARMREASELAQRDPKTAVEAYDKLAGDTSLGAILQELASIRAAALLIDTAGYDEIRRRLEPLSSADHTFRHTARELLAVGAWRAGDAAATRRWYEELQGDPATPPATRSRVELLLALLAADGKS